MKGGNPMVDKIKIGGFLRQLRTEQGLTQENLAEQFGVSSRSVSRWENGNTMPELGILVELAIFYAVDIKEIIDGERKSEIMEKETNETLSKVADYAKTEKQMTVRKKCLLTIVSAVGIALILFFSYSVLFVYGLPAKQDNIKVTTEVQYNDEGIAQWIINFETADGQPIYAYTKYVNTDPVEAGTETTKEVVINLRTAPLGHVNPGKYSWGHSLDQRYEYSDDYDFIVVVKYCDKTVSYSMREEGLLDNH